MPFSKSDRAGAVAPEGGDAKRAYVREMFSAIAPRYDLLNHLLSFRIDYGWRRAALAALRWERHPTATYVDVCAGTLDVATALTSQAGFRGRVVAVDFAEPMLRAGSAKIAGRAVAPVVGDALWLPLADGACAGVVVAFGVRNLADLDAGLREIYRVLIPGGRAVVLEFSTPRSKTVRLLYGAYLHGLLPLVGRVISGHPTAYRYLPRSVARFPAGDELAQHMRAAGFVDVRWRPLTWGVAALYAGERAAGVARGEAGGGAAEARVA